MKEMAKIICGYRAVGENYNSLWDSKYHFEDRCEDNKQPYTLFNDTDYTDKDYYKQYPTVFHLRKELLDSTDKHDVRLIFLALLNMYKHRGNFLSDSIDADASSSIEEAYFALVTEAEKFEIIFDASINTKKLLELLGDKNKSRTQIKEEILKFMDIEKPKKDDAPAIARYELINLICGISGKIVNIFGKDSVSEDDSKLSISFRDSNYEEKEADVRDVIGDDNFELIAAAKVIHDIGYLENIKKGETYLTCARVKSYKEHKNDLMLLKSVLKKYDMDAYNTMFREMNPGNYSAYVGSVNSDKIKQRRSGGNGSRDELYKNIKKLLTDGKKFPQDDSDIQKILERIANETFLPKQLTFANGVIPNQIYVSEMKQILSNAENYCPFLLEKNEYGLTVSEQIVEVFSFRIPYYVGPIGQEYLDKKGYNVWARRKEAGRVYPWNFEDKIDTKEAAEKFIQRMVRRCSYLSDETCLPKCSLMYEKFMVLNELNNLKVNDTKISEETKQDIYNTLLKKGKRVTINHLKNYFINSGLVEKDATDFLSGVDLQGFKSSLSSLGKFLGVFGQDALRDDYMKMEEKIIFWATVYGNDKKFLKEKITEEYGSVINEKQLKRILGFKFDGWGNLSREFLELEGGSRKDGCKRSIIQTLWETNDNLMQILSSDYTYAEVIQEQINLVNKSLSEWTIDDLDGMYLSAPVKRMVWQTLKIMKEIETVKGKAPDRIFIEMAREDGEKGVRTISRKKKLDNLYTAMKAEGKVWKEEIEKYSEAEFRQKKLYLYYLQQGKCMYTGQPIDLDELMKKNSKYDIDHIYPQHYVKDDSLENNNVLVLKEENGRKSDDYPLDANIQKKMYGIWKHLADSGLMTQEKFRRLTRTTKFTDEELSAFINRQLVETRQGTKAITQIIQQAYPDSEVVFSKAGVVSDFRHQFDLPKVRCINDLHHAQDAYLNIVVGNTYYVKFTKNPLNYIKAAKKDTKEEYAYHMGKIFLYDVKRNGEVAWIAPEGKDKDEKLKSNTGTIKTVKNMMSKNTPLITKRSFLAHGGITRKDTVRNKLEAKPYVYLPMNTSDSKLSDVTKYGGRSDVTPQCFCLVSYQKITKMKTRDKIEDILSIESIPIYLGNIAELSNEKLFIYLQKYIENENPKNQIRNLEIKLKCIKIKSLIKIDGFYYFLAAKSDKRILLEKAEPLFLSDYWYSYIKKLEKAYTKDYYDEKDSSGKTILTSSNNVALYDTIIEKLTNTTYKNMKISIVNILQEKRNLFEIRKIQEQVYILIQIIMWLNLNYSGVDLRLLDASATSGIMRISKKLNNCKEAKLYITSPAGLYRKEIDLLSL
jgi:CRISPR-associated endonuclease Csn1